MSRRVSSSSFDRDFRSTHLDHMRTKTRIRRHSSNLLGEVVCDPEGSPFYVKTKKRNRQRGRERERAKKDRNDTNETVS